MFEWNEAVIGSSRGLRGGSFFSYGHTLHAASRRDGGPADEYDVIGFRVAQVPEPTTLMVLAIGAIGILGKTRW